MAFFEKQKMKLRFQRFVKNYFENPTKHLQKRHQGITITVEIGFQHYKMVTPIKPLKEKSEFDGSKGELLAEELEIFKLTVEKYLENRQVESS